MLLADDHAILREGMRLLLARETDMDVVGEASTGEQTLEMVRACLPDIVVLDVGMPGENTSAVASRIRVEQPATRVVVLTMHHDVGILQSMIRAGVSAYLIKDYAATQLVAVLRLVATGGLMVFPATLGASVLAMPADSGAWHENVRLTQREAEIVRLIAQGLTNHDIAAVLVVSEKTVQSHRAHIMGKLGLHDRVGIVRYAMRHGLCLS